MLPLGKLGYGVAQIGNLYREGTDENAIEAVSAAWDAGVRYFDTAPHYGLGLSEKRLGMALAGRPRDDYIISTKVGRDLVPNPHYSGELDLDNGFAVPATLIREPAYDYDGIRRSLEGSLERMGVDSVDIIYIHDPDAYDLHPMLDSALPAVEKLRAEGLARAVGIGSKSVEALHRGVVDADLDILMVAGRFTLLEQPAADILLPACVEHGVEVVVAAPFNSGLLATSTPSVSDRYEYGSVPEEVLQRARDIAALCHSYGVELPAAALQYPLRHPAVVNVVVGATTSKQILQSIHNMDQDIPEELWADLERTGLAPRY
jgi:D-threo-aldose 1-dehydrogenase